MRYVYPMLAYFSLVPEGAAKLAQFDPSGPVDGANERTEQCYFFPVFRGKIRCWFTLIRLVHCFFIINPHIDNQRRRDRMYVLRFGKRF